MAKRQSVQLHLICCGETIWDAAGRVLGASDLPLSPDGRLKLQAAKAELTDAHPAMIHHPADESASETARIIAGHVKARTKEVADLRDPHLGLLEGVTEQEFAERYPTRYRQWEEDPISFSPPEGEEIAAAADRIFSTIVRITRRSRSDEIGIVLHRIGYALARCWLADQPLNQLRSMMQSPPMIERHVIPMESLKARENAARWLHANR